MLFESLKTKQINFERLQEVQRITGEIISALDPAGIQELLGGYDNDFESLLDGLFNETYNSLYSLIENPKQDYLSSFNSANVYYLDRLCETTNKVISTENFLYFYLTILKDSHDVNWHHIEWADCIKLYRLLCILAARGHGKSKFFTTAYGIWKCYRYNSTSKRKDLNALGKEGYIFSNTTRQANRLLTDIKETIEGNNVLREALKPREGWSETSILNKNGSKIVVLGMGSSVRGPHPGWIVCDDLLDDSSLYSKDQRDKTIEYFYANPMKMLEPDGQILLIGTPLHSEDLYGSIKKKKGWHLREYPAIFPNGKILWESRFSFEALMQEKDESTKLTFSRERLVKPITDGATLFPMEELTKAIIRMESFTMVKNIQSFPMRFDRVSIGCDFAISGNIGSDSSVFTAMGLTEDGKIYILNMYRLTGKSYAEQVAVMKMMNANFKPDVIFAEDNGFQQIFVQECKKEGLPILGNTTTAKNKYDEKIGLPMLALQFQLGNIKIPVGDEYSRNIKDVIFGELNGVTYNQKGLQNTTGHDDCAMSIWKGVLGLKDKMGFDFMFV